MYGVIMSACFMSPCLLWTLFLYVCWCVWYNNSLFCSVYALCIFMSTSVLCMIIFAGVVCIVMSAGVLCIVMYADEFDKCAALKRNRINTCVIIKFLAYELFQLVLETCCACC